MINYAGVNSSFKLENNSSQNKNQTQKSKFITNSNPNDKPHGYWSLDRTKSQSIDCESNLITPKINKKEKIQMKLNDEFSPSDYKIQYKNSLPTENCNLTDDFYYMNKDLGAGRGFGNLNISNDIRYGDASRYDTKQFKQTKESEQLFDYQFQYLDRNFQDPNHIVMSIPRGGESTRKQNQLHINTMREPTHDLDERLKTIKFNY